MIIPKEFYTRANVVRIARELLGKYLVTKTGNVVTSGIITETEAYAGVTDRASHAFGNRRTARTEIMYHEGGVAYIYLCYGVHSLFNIVTNVADIPHAVLIRGIRPVEGMDAMLARSQKTVLAKDAGSGPGNVTTLLGIHYSSTGAGLTGMPSKNAGSGIWLEDRGKAADPRLILVTPRIGVQYAGRDALLPYRFLLKL